MGKTSTSRPVRVTVYMDQQQHHLLKVKLVTQGITVSEWFRRKIREFLDED